MAGCRYWERLKQVKLFFTKTEKATSLCTYGRSWKTWHQIQEKKEEEESRQGTSPG